MLSSQFELTQQTHTKRDGCTLSYAKCMKKSAALGVTLVFILAGTTIGCGGKLEAGGDSTTTVATPELVWETLRQEYNKQYPAAPLADAGTCQLNPREAGDTTNWVCTGSLGPRQTTITVTRDAKTGKILYQESP